MGEGDAMTRRLSSTASDGATAKHAAGAAHLAAERAGVVTRDLHGWVEMADAAALDRH